MSKILVLAEKPSVGRDLARVLRCNRKNSGYLEGDRYVVTWALGHLVTLADPEVYSEKYKNWNLEDLPMLPEKLKLVVIKQSGKQFNIVKAQMNRKDIGEIVIATDSGREGELVARWIIEKARIKKPLKRLWISSQTDKSIINGFKNLKPSSKYDNLYRAAQCRAEADWVVGLNITRALTCKYNAQLTAGRVQSATLAMIVNREKEINDFKPKDYYEITAKSDKFKLKWVDRKSGRANIFNKDKADGIVKKINGKICTVVDVVENDKRKFSPALYDLTELQRDANRIFNYSAKETLSIMQRLYENYKILTYPRTDSRYISTDVFETIPERLKAISLGSYKKFADRIMSKKINAHKGFVDNGKIGDHHAIIPTEERVQLSRLSTEEMNIYDLVVKRFLAVMLPPYEYVQTSVKADIAGELFTAVGNVVKSKGWKMVYERGAGMEAEGEKDSQLLPKVKKGDIVNIRAVELNKLQTKPPARFNEATLLSAMENPQKYVKLDSESAKTLGETGGIGTVATRADIIEKLFNMFYVEKRGREIVPTSKGKQLVDLVPEGLKSPLMTAKWEKELEDISTGNEKPDIFSKKMRKYAVRLVEDVKKSKDKFVYDNVTGKKCPHCGKYMLQVKGKSGMMYICQDRECGYRENISRFTNVRCPECHKKLELRGEGQGKIYVCPNCSFREKADLFNKRFKESENKLNRKDVSKYMKKIKKENEKPINSSLAEALSKLKLK
ncbi:DNA topoisomerase 3 [Clostridium sp. MT-14]|uniref:DNA topoisomerase 3 n=1 Tax=Clostridium aromativorans TaxID=2836848 RepID=A0ABS8N6E1_9CLOT|nr:DNA topoisomerase III [Clostridium aromativorans]MCC9295389.1 DNA topoisomerase III [Clostridium aromativorans]